MYPNRVMSVLSKIDLRYIDTGMAVELYAELLGDVYQRLSCEELQRLMIIGAYLYRTLSDELGIRDNAMPAVQWRGNLNLN